MQSSIKNISLVLIALITVGGSFFIGFSVGNKEALGAIPQGIVGAEQETIDFQTFWSVWNIINERYVSKNGPTDDEKVWAATSGLVSSLGDPYSVFFPPKEAELFESEVRGNFSGVGIEIGMEDDILTVIAPLKGTPAYLAGIKAGDKIVQIGELSTFGLTIDDSVGLIRGEEGTPVVLTVAREGEEELLQIEIIRGTIQIPILDTELRDDGIFVITLNSFSATSPSLFRDALREFVETKGDKLILDLRNNPGGFLDAAVDISSWFLPAGKIVATERGREETIERSYRSKGYNIFTDNLKFVILMNRGSASASEILAGALSEYEKATIIGEQSFGKGSVQELISINDKTSIKLTIARWFTPFGVSISENGLTPDIEVAFTRADAEAEIDPQLEKAVETLLAQ